MSLPLIGLAGGLVVGALIVLPWALRGWESLPDGLALLTSAILVCGYVLVFWAFSQDAVRRNVTLLFVLGVQLAYLAYQTLAKRRPPSGYRSWHDLWHGIKRL
jgi:hypothetical protein